MRYFLPSSLCISRDLAQFINMVVGPVIITTDTDGDGEDKLTKRSLQVAIVSAIGGFLFGYDTGIISGAMIYIKSEFALNYEWQEIIVSITIASAWMFSMIAGPASSSIGRKKVLYIASYIFIFGSILMAIAWEKWSLFAGRFIVGAAIGLASTVVPMLIAETAPSSVRGILVTTNNLFVTFGQAMASLTAGFAGMLPDESFAWRLMLGIAAVPAVLQVIGLFLWMPESPRWLVQKGYDEKAREVLIYLRGEDANVENELNGIKRANDEFSGLSQKSTFQILRLVMKNKNLRTALFTGCVLSTVQQVTGINTVMYYSATIIQMSGIHDKNIAVWMSTATACMNFAVSFIALALVERMGRRKLTLWSLFGVICTLILLGISFLVLDSTAPVVQHDHCIRDSNIDPDDDMGQLEEKFHSCASCISSELCGFCFNASSDRGNDNFYCYPIAGEKGSGATHSPNNTRCSSFDKSSFVWAEDWCPSKYSWLTLLAMCTYLFCFGSGLGPMPWTINSELFPLWCRSACFAATTAIVWIFNLLISLTFLSSIKIFSKAGTFWLYAFLGIIGYCIFYFFLPETKGRSLEADIGPDIEQQEIESRRRASTVLMHITQSLPSSRRPTIHQNYNRSTTSTAANSRKPSATLELLTVNSQQRQ